MWRKGIMNTYSSEEKGTLTVMSGHTYSCEGKVYWIPTAIRKEFYLLKSLALTEAMKGR